MTDNEDNIVANVTEGEKLKILCGGLHEITEEAQTTWLKNNVSLRQADLAATLISRS